MIKLFHELLLARAESQPDELAIVGKGRSWTYAQLRDRSLAYAVDLRAFGLGIEDRVCCVLDNSHEGIALLAALSMTGVTFSVISPEAPTRRRDTVIEDVGARCLFVQSDRDAPADVALPIGFFAGDRLGFNHAPLPAGPALGGPRLIDTNIAYVLYTSGSTGRPKGIALSHLGAVTFLLGLIERYGLRPGDRYSSSSPLQFDFALMDMCLALGSGATLVMLDRNHIRKPALLIDELLALEVTHFAGVPTLWKLILRFARDRVGELRHLRSIIFGGEHFPIEHINTLYELLPRLTFMNVYGQAESIACTYLELPRPLPPGIAHLPVGTGHPDVEMFLIDDDGRRVTTPHTPAELYLRGKLLFSGYLNNPVETARRLIQNPLKPDQRETVFRTGDICYFDAAGMFYFVGRQDNQVKVNGNRVELEEIEAVLLRHPVVSDVCVVAHEREQRVWLHAFVVWRGSAASADGDVIDSLRGHGMAHLPSYMCPAHFHIVDRIPLSSNGKSDRKSLLARLQLQAAS